MMAIELRSKLEQARSSVWDAVDWLNELLEGDLSDNAKIILAEVKDSLNENWDRLHALGVEWKSEGEGDAKC